MSMTKVFKAYGVTVDAEDMASSALIGGITRQWFNPGTEIRDEITSGDTSPRLLYIPAKNPRLGFSSLAIAQALNIVGLSGRRFTDSDGGVDLHFQKVDATGSAHQKLHVTQGLIFGTRLSAEHQADATIDCDVAVTYDGTNIPVVATPAQPLPSGLTDAERFTLGGVTINGVAITQVTGWDLDFGLNVVTRGSEADIYPTIAYVESIQPTITLRGLNPDWMNTGEITLDGQGFTHANTKLWLVKRKSGGTVEADEATEHILITAAGLAVIDDAEAAGNGPASCSAKLRFKFDGTNAPVTFTTDTAIS